MSSDDIQRDSGRVHADVMRATEEKDAMTPHIAIERTDIVHKGSRRYIATFPSGIQYGVWTPHNQSMTAEEEMAAMRRFAEKIWDEFNAPQSQSAPV